MHRFRYTIILSVTGFFIALVSVVIAGGGHGTILPAMWLFPWAFIENLWKEQVSETYALVAIFIQFPVYGLIYDINRRWYIIVIIFAIHIIFALVLINKQHLIA